MLVCGVFVCVVVCTCSLVRVCECVYVYVCNAHAYPQHTHECIDTGVSCVLCFCACVVCLRVCVCRNKHGFSFGRWGVWSGWLSHPTFFSLERVTAPNGLRVCVWVGGCGGGVVCLIHSLGDRGIGSFISCVFVCLLCVPV